MRLLEVATMIWSCLKIASSFQHQECVDSTCWNFCMRCILVKLKVNKTKFDALDAFYPNPTECWPNQNPTNDTLTSLATVPLFVPVLFQIIESLTTQLSKIPWKWVLPGKQNSNLMKPEIKFWRFWRILEYLNDEHLAVIITIFVKTLIWTLAHSKVTFEYIKVFPVN